MTRNDDHQARRGPRAARALRLTALAGAVVLALGLAAQAPASAAARPAAGPAAASAPHGAIRAVRELPAAAADAAALRQAFAAGRHLPAGAVGGIRAGSEHLASVSGTGVSWAIASFTPSPAAPRVTQTAFQDGASTGVFRRAPGQSWQLVRASGGAYGCGRGLPAAVRAAWKLAAPAGCQATAASARQAAARARQAAAPAGMVGQSIASIALSQVGVADTPAVTSFSGVDCDPYTTMVAAQSPNANGCAYDQAFTVENENEAWCSDFAKWVWQQAGVTADMGIINAGSDSFYGWGASQGEAMPADSGTPEPGDAVVFYPPGPVSATAYADHVGIVTSVNADGTINMANGDFLGTTNISVQYNTGINLATWPSQVWGKGEQWILVTPPAGQQQPVPAAAISGPHRAVAGTSVTLTAHAAQPGGSISRVLWTFGDGRDNNTTGATVRHVFAGAGVWPVTMTATSGADTVTTRTWDIDVAAAGSAVASTPNTAVWYSARLVDQYLFLPAAGGLAAESSDGESWLRYALPGRPDAGSGLTALNYADGTGIVQPHVFYRAAGGGLGETSGRLGSWTAQALPGDPASGAAIVATTGATNGADASSASQGPAVFYVNSAGQLAESAEQGSSWTASTLAGLPAAGGGSLALADVTSRGQPGELLAYLSRHGGLLVASPAGPPGAGQTWRAQPVPAASGIAAGTALAAVTAGPDGSQQLIFFLNGHGQLAAAARQQPGSRWLVRDLPGIPAAATALAATTYQLPSGGLGTEVFYCTASGQPGVTAWDGQQWQASTLLGTAGGVVGAAGYPGAGHPEQVFLGSGTAPVADSSADSGGTWTPVALPTAVSAFTDTVVLYAATAADDASALSAAAAAGLPASQVTQSFATAWADTLSGEYLVIAVGQAASSALYYNVCGWPD
ncbi:MAG TPA: PKD domain-containing protein, partial [Streptosporangiaceae bacterium]|nr:PKD domain-containing protein [Streptosporangiaceae bacterium]